MITADDRQGPGATALLDMRDAARPTDDGQDGRFLRAAARRARDLVLVLDADRNVVFASRPPGSVVGLEDDASFERLARLLEPSEQLRIGAALDEAAARPGTPVPLGVHVRVQDGQELWFEGDVTDLCHDPAVGGIVVRLLDVSRERLVLQELDTTRHRDPVTGLPNREHFRELVDEALARSVEGESVHVVLFDLDGFRRLNDSLGHEWGDRLLASVARRMAWALRSGDRLARLGADEFAVLLGDGPGEGHADAVVRRLRRALEQPFGVDGRRVDLSACFGVAAGATTADNLLRDAEMAMYRAKAGGADGMSIFQPGMEQAAVELLELELDLRQAVARGAIDVAFQPVVDLADGRVVGMEALARWDRPGHGPVPAGRFIPLAEQLGIIRPLGRAVLRQACRRAAAWNAASARDVGVSVNLSTLQLEHPAVVAEVQAVLAVTGLRPDLLTLEITESTLMRDVAVTTRRLHVLRSLGVRIAVDDFGTGYSSLGHLCHVPLDVLKIDRSLVAGLGAGGPADAVGRVLVDLGRALGVETVAEGIETTAEADFLRGLGCPLGQGFLYGRPMAPAAAEALLHTRPVHLAAQAAPRKATSR